MDYIEEFRQIDSRWAYPSSGKVIRVFMPNDLSDWCAHGEDFSKPFADTSKRSKKWCVSHTKTLRRLPEHRVGKLTFKQALSLAAYLDESLSGMSQIHEAHDLDIITNSCELDGWTDDFKTSVRDAIAQWRAMQ